MLLFLNNLLLYYCYGMHNIELWIFVLDQGGFRCVGINHETWFRELRSHDIVLWSLENLLIYKSLGKGTSCAWEDISSLVHPPYGKLHYWLIVFFLGHVFFSLVYLKFKKGFLNKEIHILLIWSRSLLVKRFIPYQAKTYPF
jgi:hypothetical protein